MTFKAWGQARMVGFHRWSGRLRRAASVALAVAVAGCSSIGPSTMPRDRTDYLSALATSWKEQTLSNVEDGVAEVLESLV